MKPIYDRNGDVVAWKTDAIIYDLAGETVAFLNGNNLISYDGQHLGVLDRGFVRDPDGDAVAFLQGAIGGPIPPIPSIPPIPPIPAIAPIPPIPPISPIPAISSLGWSGLDWDSFIDGESD